MDRGRFQRVLDRLGDKLLRLKGEVAFEDTGQRRFVEVAGGEWIEQDSRAPEESGSTFVAIGWNITREELSRRFAKAISR